MSKPIPDSRMGGLFSKKKDTAITENESEIMSHGSLLMSNESKDMSRDSEDTSHESLPRKHESGVMHIDSQALEAAVAQGRKDPRISTYSPFVMSMLRYLRKTTPEFSMSEAASELLENAIREKYPELSEQVEKALFENPAIPKAR